jgi:RNA polymerase sigma-70 factor (ECF subfamily)
MNSRLAAEEAVMTDLSSDSTRTDSGLLDEVRNPQNHVAWKKFTVRYGPMIRGWCRHWFPREADDKACEVFSELVFRMITFEYDRSKGRFRGWLKTVTHNLMAKLKRDVFPEVDADDNPMDSVEAAKDLASRLAAEFDLEQLEIAKERVCSRVQPHTWAAYLATAEEGRKPAEVAHELGMKVGSVFQAKHSVIALLRQDIEASQGPA